MKARDSKKKLNELVLEAWQDRWKQCKVGRWTAVW